MAKKSLADSYAQRATVDMATNLAPPGTQSEQFASTHSATDRVGIVIERVNYSFEEDFIPPANTENMVYGLSFIQAGPDWNRDGFTGMLDFNSWTGYEFGAPAAGLLGYPIRNQEKDFTSLTGGGILCHPTSLWFFIGAFNAFAWNNIDIAATLWYHTIELSEDLYRELWELRIIAQGI